MEKIDNKMLPVPLKYTYPVLMEFRRSGKLEPHIYVPEINKWIYIHSLFRELRKYKIDRFLWELRWIYKVDGKILANKNLLADEIVKTFYGSKLNNTKKFIKSKLLEDITYKCDFFCLKTDLIDLYYNREVNSTTYFSWYDFSKVPFFIKTKTTNFKVVVKEKDFITGEQIEDWTTNIKLFYRGNDCPRVAKHKELILLFIEAKEKFKNSAINKFGDFVDYSKVEYKGIHVPVKLKCKICGNIYYQSPIDHLTSSINTHGCSECNKRYLRGLFSDTFEDFVSKSRKIHGDRYTYFKKDFVDYNTPTKIYDNIRKEYFLQTPKKHVRGHGNNECQNSMGEGLIKTWLVDNNINFNYGVVINGLIQGRNIDRVIIDFTVSLNNSTIWIEYQGIQHYKETNFFYYNNESTFEKQLQRDKNVREYCKNNHIQLIEIPYTYKNYESVKNLLDRVILNGEDINSIIDYQSLYNN